MTFTETGQLYLLPCDHRDILKGLWTSSDRDLDERSFVVAAKELVLDGLLAAESRGVDLRSAALLMDDEFGAPVLARAREHGVARFLPVDTGEVGPFALQHGDRFAEVVEAVDPEVVTALVAFHPDGVAGPPPSDQLASMEPLADWSRDTARDLMLELQVSAPQPTEPAWLEQQRPTLISRAIDMLAGVGFAPTIWKIEGCVDQSGYEEILAAVRRTERPDAEIVVLGAGASAPLVVEWLTTAAQVPQYTGFAVGRSVWFEGIDGWARGRHSEEAAVEAIATEYARFAGAFAAATGSSAQAGVSG